MATKSGITTRLSPETQGVNMGAPSQDAQKHAKDRLTHQTRLLTLLCAMRMKGDIPKTCVVTAGKTHLQHGQGGEGQQAAHKIIVALDLDGKSMLEYCEQNSVLKLAVVYLLSETTVLPRGYNMADDYLEGTGGMRQAVITTAQFIVAESYDGPTSEFEKFKARIMAAFSDIHSRYVNQCTILGRWSRHDDLPKHQKSLEALEGSKDKTPPAKYESQKTKFQTNCRDALAKADALDEYCLAVTGMKFPLLDAELENMFEVVFERAPAKDV